MKRIALTGGIACGKSLVARYLNELGVATIDADDIVHEILPDPAERKRLAAEVFADPEKRKALEARLHPMVRERINDRITELLNNRMVREDQSSTDNSVIQSFGNSVISPPVILPPIAIIPLLFETRWDADYDIICAVVSARETQVNRMITTRGYTREEAEARLAAQMPVSEKAARSHYVIENDGPAEELRLKVAAFVDWLKSKANV